MMASNALAIAGVTKERRIGRLPEPSVSERPSDQLRYQRLVAGFVAGALGVSAVGEDDRRDRFAEEITASLREQSLEDGAYHPAEDILCSAMQELGSEGPRWILSFYSRLIPQPSLAADLVQISARLPEEVGGDWEVQLAEAALQHRDVYVRDSAARALSHWGGPGCLRALRQHQESEPWLAAYIRDVIEDLSE